MWGQPPSAVRRAKLDGYRVKPVNQDADWTLAARRSKLRLYGIIPNYGH